MSKKSLKKFTKSIEKSIEKGKIEIKKSESQQEVEARASIILQEMQGVREFISFTDNEVAREVQKHLAERETTPVQLKEVTSSVSKISMGGDNNYAAGYEVIFGKKKIKKQQ